MSRITSSSLFDWLQTQPHAELTTDSRKVGPASVFFAIRGTTADGHKYLPEVTARKPLAVVVEDRKLVPSSYQGLVYEVSSTRMVLVDAANCKYGYPSRELKVYGVTGTNGKTTITHLIELLSQSRGDACGVLGTIDHHLGSHRWSSALTTPDPVTLQSRLREMRHLGASAVAMEVSSHALDQGRAAGIEFDVGVFSNLTRDHLDYHNSMENYFAAKRQLFDDLLVKSPKPLRRAVINGDDPWGQKIQIPSLSVFYGRSQNCNVRIGPADLQYNGSQFSLFLGTKQIDVETALIGDFNIYNAVAALTAVADEISVESFSKLIDPLANFTGVCGRLERVAAKPFTVLVDYAHTDDALRSVLNTLKDVREKSKTQSRIIVVFGCGGDRDKGKRPLMMRAALDGAECVVVTSDNPRSEDPMAIIQDSFAAVTPDEKNRVHLQADRRKAIEWALNDAAPGDVVVVAGKGHEVTQQIGDIKYPFCDQDVVREILGF